MVIQDEQFIRILKTRPSQRLDVELRYISYYLQTLPPVNHLNPTALQALSRSIYYDCREKGTIVYNAKDIANCWYILLSGSVCVETAHGIQYYQPTQSFGREISEYGQRGYACFAIEFSEFIVIDFPNRNICHFTSTEAVASKLRAKVYDSNPTVSIPRHPIQHSNAAAAVAAHRWSNHHSIYEQANKVNVDTIGAYLNLEFMGGALAKHHRANKPQFNHSNNNRLSISSNGSSFMTSDGGESMGSNPRLDEYHVYSQISKPPESHVQFSNYPVPVDDEIYSELNQYDMCFDDLKILKKAPIDRSAEDVKLLADYLQHFTAFSSMSVEMRLDFAYVMKYAHVEQKNKIILQNGEQLDSWCVVINGEVLNAKEDGSKKIYRTGQCFGLNRKLPIPQFHQGSMITLEKDCQFVAIPQKEYFEVVEKHNQYERIVFDGNRTVLVTEARDPNDEIEDESHVVKLGEPGRLVSHLVEDHSSLETSYVEDFLLTYRTFIKDSTYISDKLEKWYSEHSTACMKERITKVVFTWVANHYIDFESNSSLSYFLEKFYDKLIHEGKVKEINNLMKVACRKGNVRKLELDPTLRKDGLPFNLMTPLGGKGSFIKTFKFKVQGLKVGDQLIAVNNKNVENLSYRDCMDMIFSQEYCWLTIKHNVLGMKRVVSKQSYTCDNSEERPLVADNQCVPNLLNPSSHQDALKRAQSMRTPPVISNLNGGVGELNKQQSNKGQSGKQYETSKLKKMAKKFAFLPPNPLTKMLSNSTSNPDVSNLSGGSKIDESSDFALKIYNIEQNYKYIGFSELTSVRHIVNKAVEAFEYEFPDKYVIYHVEVSADGMVKQTRLAEQHRDIIDRIRPATRFYIKSMEVSDRLLPNESIAELQKEASVQFLDLKPLELAIQLMLRDLNVAQNILPHQYVEMLWKLPTKDCNYINYTTIDDFTDLTNKEMFWVIHTICSEKSLTRRSKVIKRFIKIAKFCRELRNFNSMFAILSGLGYSSVTRLEYTWEKVSSREMKLKSVLDEVLDPSRNMAKYRSLLSVYKGSTPVIPIYPIFIKDLTVYHLGNESKIDDLINFEKLRLISKEIKCFYTSISSKPDRDFLKSLITKPNKMVYLNANTAGTTDGAFESSKSVTDITVPHSFGQRNGVLHKPQRKSLSLLNSNPKKIYEEILMCKRVEQYIKKLCILSDEDALRKMSETCEPPPANDYDIESILPPPPIFKQQDSVTTDASASDNASVLSQDKLNSNLSDCLSITSSNSAGLSLNNSNNANYDIPLPAVISQSNSSGSNSVLKIQTENLSLSEKDVLKWNDQSPSLGFPCVDSAVSSDRASVSSSGSNNSKRNLPAGKIGALIAASVTNPQSRDSMSKAAASGTTSSANVNCQRSKSVSRVDDKLMRIPSTPSFVANKPITVKHHNVSGIAISPTPTSPIPPTATATNVPTDVPLRHSTRTSSGSFDYQITSDANTNQNSSTFVLKPHPQMTFGSQKLGCAQISFARSLSLVSQSSTQAPPSNSFISTKSPLSHSVLLSNSSGSIVSSSSSSMVQPPLKQPITNSIPPNGALKNSSLLSWPPDKSLHL